MSPELRQLLNAFPDLERELMQFGFRRPDDPPKRPLFDTEEQKKAARSAARDEGWPEYDAPPPVGAAH